MRFLILFIILLSSLGGYSQKQDNIKTNCYDIHVNENDFEIYDAYGNIYSCGLFINDAEFTHEYFCFENDSTLLFVKSTCISDSSFFTQYFKKTEIKIDEINKHSCWVVYMNRSFYSKNGTLLKTDFYDDYYLTKPKRINVLLKK